jgi:hypothetical protein
MALLEMTPYPDINCKGILRIVFALISPATLEEFEYLALKLNMVALQPIKVALSFVSFNFVLMSRVVGPGADILLKAIEPFDPNLTPNTMTIEQWRKLGDAFHDWVFKPDVLEDEAFIDDDIVEESMNTSVLPTRELSDAVKSSLDQYTRE